MKCNIIAKIIVISILSSMLIGSTSSFAEDLTSQETSDIQDMTMEASEVTEEEVSEEVVTSENDEEGREDEKQEEENLARDSYNKTEVSYRTHVQTYGWQEWTADDSISGTTGEAKRLEAIQIQLTGEMAEHFDVYYRVHSQTYGWLG